MTKSSTRRVQRRTASRSPSGSPADGSVRKLLRAPFVRVCLLVSTPLYITGLVHSADSVDGAVVWFIGAFLTGAFGWLPLGARVFANLSKTPQRRPAGPESLGLVGAFAYLLATTLLVIVVRAIWA